MSFIINFTSRSNILMGESIFKNCFCWPALGTEKGSIPVSRSPNLCSINTLQLFGNFAKFTFGPALKKISFVSLNSKTVKKI